MDLKERVVFVKKFLDGFISAVEAEAVFGLSSFSEANAGVVDELPVEGFAAGCGYLKGTPVVGTYYRGLAELERFAAANPKMSSEAKEAISMIVAAWSIRSSDL